MRMRGRRLWTFSVEEFLHTLGGVLSFHHAPLSMFPGVVASCHGRCRSLADMSGTIKLNFVYARR